MHCAAGSLLIDKRCSVPCNITGTGLRTRAIPVALQVQALPVSPLCLQLEKVACMGSKFIKL